MMPTYSYEGFSQAGAKEAGRLDAASETIAYEVLASRGITASSLTANGIPPVQKAWYNRDIKFASGELARQEQASVIKFMAVLFRSNLSILEVLNVIQNVTTNSCVQTNFARVSARIAEGESISSAFDAEAKIFAPVFYGFVRVSDRTNELPRLLDELATQLERQAKTQNKVMSALIYPAILVISAVFLVLIVVLFLVPSLRPIFESLETEPAANVRLLLWANDMLRSYWSAILAATTLFIVGLIWFATSPGARSIRANTLARMPFIGPLIYEMRLSQLCRSTYLMLDMGEPLAPALQASANALQDTSSLYTTWQSAAQAIEQGSSASAVFSQDTRMPVFFKELFRIGEEANQLSGALKAIADTLSEQVEQKSTRLVGLMTPILTLAMGVGIGGLIYTIMTAITEVNNVAF